MAFVSIRHVTVARPWRCLPWGPVKSRVWRAKCEPWEPERQDIIRSLPAPRQGGNARPASVSGAVTLVFSIAAPPGHWLQRRPLPTATRTILCCRPWPAGASVASQLRAVHQPKDLTGAPGPPTPQSALDDAGADVGPSSRWPDFPHVLATRAPTVLYRYWQALAARLRWHWPALAGRWRHYRQSEVDAAETVAAPIDGDVARLSRQPVRRDRCSRPGPRGGASSADAVVNSASVFEHDTSRPEGNLLLLDQHLHTNTAAPILLAQAWRKHFTAT